MLGGIGVQEIVIILIVGLLVFGAARLPKIARSLGQGIKEFKKTVKGLEEDDEEENRMRYVPHQQPTQGYAYSQGQQMYPGQGYNQGPAGPQNPGQQYQQYNPAQPSASPDQTAQAPYQNQPGQNPQYGNQNPNTASGPNMNQGANQQNQGPESSTQSGSQDQEQA